MRSWKLEVGRRSRSRAAVIAGAVLASAFASVLLVSAQSSLKPPCNQFTDPNCHPAPPVVTAKASQTVAGDVNVTGKLCVGAAPGQVCFGGTAGGGAVPDSVSSGTLTVFQKAIDFTDRVGTEQPAKFNVRTFLQEKTGVDPGAVKAVVIRAEMFGGQNPNYYGAYYQEHAGRFWAAPAGVNLLNVDDLNADVYMVVRMLYGQVTSCGYRGCTSSYKTVYSASTQVIPTNSTNEIVMMFSNNGQCPQDGRYCQGVTVSSLGRFRILGFYK